ncbi:unnamed protein product, partial [Laminaria digitata]
MSAKCGKPASTSLVSAHVRGLLLRSQNSRSEKSSSSSAGSSAKYIRSSRSTIARRVEVGTPAGALLPALAAFDLATRSSRLCSRSETTLCFLAGAGSSPPPAPPPPADEDADPACAFSNVLATLLTSSIAEALTSALPLARCSSEHS